MQIDEKIITQNCVVARLQKLLEYASPRGNAAELLIVACSRCRYGLYMNSLYLFACTDGENFIQIHPNSTSKLLRQWAEKCKADPVTVTNKLRDISQDFDSRNYKAWLESAYPVILKHAQGGTKELQGND
jgi:hypothetical protein